MVTDEPQPRSPATAAAKRSLEAFIPEGSRAPRAKLKRGSMNSLGPVEKSQPSTCVLPRDCYKAAAIDEAVEVFLPPAVPGDPRRR